MVKVGRSVVDSWFVFNITPLLKRHFAVMKYPTMPIGGSTMF